MKRNKSHIVLLAAAGTGGHVFPALTTAAYLTEQQLCVEWVGGFGMEATLVPQHGYKFHAIRSIGLRNKHLLRKLQAIWYVFYATLECINQVRIARPAVVMLFGGYISVPLGIAAWLWRVPVVIHEQNAIFGLSNRLLRPLASAVLSGFQLPRSIHVGNPVRADIVAVGARAQRNSAQTNLLPDKPLSLARQIKKIKILILGGSLGADFLNTIVPAALSLILPQIANIVHQTGRDKLQKTQERYRQFQITNVTITAFITDMATAYQAADLVICRAGALTVAEICCAAKAAVFIPYPAAVDNHQTANVKHLLNTSSAIVLQQATLTAQTLATVIATCSYSRCKELGGKANTFALTNSMNNIMGVLNAVIKRS